MNSIKTEEIGEGKLAELLPLWKGYSGLSAGLRKEAAGAEIILRWLVNLVEYKLKNEALKSAKVKLNEVYPAPHHILE